MKRSVAQLLRAARSLSAKGDCWAAATRAATAYQLAFVLQERGDLSARRATRVRSAAARLVERITHNCK